MAKQMPASEDGTVVLEIGDSVQLGPWVVQISEVHANSVNVTGKIGDVHGNTVTLSKGYAIAHLID
jgi:hypothetical protein